MIEPSTIRNWLLLAAFIVTSTVAIEARYAGAGNVSASFEQLQNEIKQGRIQESINNDRLWIETLEIKLSNTTDATERDQLLRQIHRLEQQIEANGGRLE